MPLNDATIRNTKPDIKQMKLYESGGLYLLVTPPNGGKEKLLSFGTYPQISLTDARDERDQANKLIKLRKMVFSR